jgi:hypothetical protein
MKLMFTELYNFKDELYKLINITQKKVASYARNNLFVLKLNYERLVFDNSFHRI